MDKIIVPIDFSDNSLNALKFAKYLAKKTNSDITLLNTYILLQEGISPRVGHLGYTYYEQISEPPRLKALEKIAEDYSDKDVKINAKIKKGTLPYVIKEMVKSEKDFTAIVMGRQGSSNIARMLWGSNTIDVINETSIPVIAVPEGTNVNKIEKILYALDFSQYDKKNIKELINFSQFFDAQLSCVHVSTYRGDRVKKQILLQILEEKLKFTSMDNVSFEFKESHMIVKGIKEYTKDHPVDLIAVMPENKSFIDNLLYTSISKEMVLHSNVPVLILRKENP